MPRNRRPRLGPLVIGLAALCGCGRPARVSPKPNLLLITVDTLRADRVSCYSDRHVRTPNMDGLGARGVVFTRAFSHCTTTLAAHADILLGGTPLYHGVHDNANFVVGEEFLTLAEHLKNSGYSTGAFIGGFPLESRFGLAQGFDTYDDRLDRVGPTPSESGSRRAEAVVTGALTWLEGRNPPWFLWIHLWDPHDPYAPPEPYKTRFADSPYDGEVAYADASLGPLFEYLARTGLDRSSVVVLTGDHGEALGEHGESTHGYLAYNPTIWIPLIIARPGQAHRIVDMPVSHVDIFPTICEALDVPPPPGLQGASLIDPMTGGRTAERPIYFESLTPFFNMDWAPLSGFIDGQEKFIDSPIPEVYDLAADPGESVNRVGRADIGAKQRKLASLVGSLTSARAEATARPSDRETVDRLRSLGYVAALPGGGRSGRTSFGPEDDVKSLLPFYNRAMEALVLYEAGRTEEAVRETEAVLDARKNISVAYLNLAHFHKNAGRLPDAIAVLERGLKNIPANHYLFLEYAACQYEAGNDRAVIAALDGWRQGPLESDPLVWNYAGLSRLRMGDRERARQCFDRALEIDGDSGVTWYNLGNLDYSVFQSTGDRSRLDAAAASLRKAVALDASNASARYVLGAALYQLEDYAGAVSNLEAALAVDPGISEALYYLGLAYLRTGEVAKACDRLRAYGKTEHYRALSAEEKEALGGLVTRFCGSSAKR